MRSVEREYLSRLIFNDVGRKGVVMVGLAQMKPKCGKNKIGVHNTSRREIKRVFGRFISSRSFLAPGNHGRSSSTSRSSIQGDSRRRGYVQRHLSPRLLRTMVGLVLSGSAGFGFTFFRAGLFCSFTQCRHLNSLGMTVTMS